MMLAVPARGQPGPEVIEALAGERAAASWHEAGHAVVQAAGGLPVHKAQVRYRRLRSIGAEHWRITASTRITRSGHAFRRVSNADLVAVMAGAEAEALWLYDNEGMTTTAARRAARDDAEDDNRQALRFAKGDRLAVLEAADEAALIVRLYRSAVAEVAALLQEHGTVTGEQVKAAVARVSPSPESDFTERLAAISAVTESDQDAGIATEAALNAGQDAVDAINARRGRS